jgi:hypothetical protein
MEFAVYRPSASAWAVMVSHHLADPLVAASEGEAAEHIDHVQDVVPDEGVLELPEIGTDPEHVDIARALMFLVPQQHLGPCSGPRTVQ